MTRQKGGGRRLLLPAVLVLAAVLFLFRPAGGDVEPTPALTPDPYGNSQAQLDPARLAEGVVSFRYTGGEEKRVKVQVTRAGGRDYNYDLANDGSWETYSLTDGEGDYTLRVLTQKENGRYTPVYTLEYALALADPKAPFLASTQFVRYEGTGAAALAEETADLRTVDLTRCAVVIGSEGRGVSPAALALCDRTVKIPMSKTCESLNAAVAAAVVLWEGARND